MKFYEVGASGTVRPIEVNIPDDVGPEASGNHVISEIQRQSPGVILPSTTASTIVIAAREGQKEGLKLKSATFGLNLGIVSLQLNWEEQKSD